MTFFLQFTLYFFLQGCSNHIIQKKIETDITLSKGNERELQIKEKFSDYNFGIEIEICSNSPIEINTIKDDNNNENELKYFTKEKDISIRCGRNSDSIYPIEFISKMVKYKDIGIITSEFFIEMNNILSCGDECEKRRTKGGNDTFSEEKFVSCGTHIHTSNKTITKKEYPNFDKIIIYTWIKYFQDDFISKYYLFQNRYKNPQCKKNTFDNFENNEGSKSKFKMLNTMPSSENQKYNYEEIWHFEFRGLGEIINNSEIIPKYIYDLIELWKRAIKLYNTDYDKIIKNIKEKCI